MTTRSIPSGGTAQKDEQAAFLYTFSYDDILATGAQLASAGTVTITPTSLVTPLTSASLTLVTGNRKAQLILSGGVIGTTYKVKHVATTNESPAQTVVDEFKLKVE